MAIEVNSNFDILGSLKLSTVPNSTGSIATWNSSTRTIGTRTNAQFVSDLNLALKSELPVYTSSLGITKVGNDFRPNYGTTANTIAQGNDSRINNGQTAFGWASLGGVSRTTVALNSSNDLNLVVESGYYHHTGARAPLNKPISDARAGYLEVVNDGGSFIRQTWRGRDNELEYQRTRSSVGVWSDWAVYYNSGNFNPSDYVPYTGATANVNLGTRSITSTGGFIGNASTATTLATARTINGTSFNGSANITTANWGTSRNITIGNTTKAVNGSVNVSWSLAEIGIPTASDYITTNTNQTGLSGDKTTNGIWTLGEIRKAGQNDTQILLAGGGHRPVSDFALSTSTIDFGGRNFLANSFNFTNASPWETYAQTTLSVEDTYLKVVGGSSNIPRFRNTRLSSMMIYEKERVYFTLSVVYKNNSGQVIGLTGKSSDSATSMNESGSQSIGSINRVSKTELDDGWIKEVFEIYALAETPTIKAGWIVVSIPQNSTFYFRSFKLEKGRVATDWTPAPEDQVSDWSETDSTKYSFIKNKPTIPTVNDGTLTLATGTGLTGSANFTANQSGNSSFSVGIASTHKLPTVAEWNALPTTNTITRLRGTASGTYTSGDLTLLAGANTTITQSGANITIASTNTNTTYTAGTGLSLTGTTFSLPITQTGTGNAVTAVTQTTNGITVTKGATFLTSIPDNFVTKDNISSSALATTVIDYDAAGNGVSILYAGNASTNFPSGLSGSTNGGLLIRGNHSGVGEYQLLLARNESDAMLYRNQSGTWYRVASREWVNSQNFSTQTLSNSTSNLIVSNTVQRSALTGDVTASQNSNVTTIANNAVTHAKYQNIPTQRILGRGATGTGNVQELTLGDNLSLSTTGVLSATNTTYSTGAIAELNSGTVATGRLWGSNVLNSWLNGKGFLTSVPTMTATVEGTAKLFSATVQSVASTAVSATASRTYGIQKNSSGQLVVNVPWTNTTYSLISVANINNPNSTTARLISGQRLDQWATDRGFNSGIFEYSTQGGIQTKDWNSFALGDKSASIGFGSISADPYTTSLGPLLYTGGFASSNQGYSSTIRKSLSSNIGAYNISNAIMTNMQGVGLINNTEGLTTIGRYNTPTQSADLIEDITRGYATPVFVIGAGTDDSDRRTILTGFKDGRFDLEQGYNDTYWNDNTLVTKKWVIENTGSGGGGTTSLVKDVSCNNNYKNLEVYQTGTITYNINGEIEQQAGNPNEGYRDSGGLLNIRFVTKNPNNGEYGYPSSDNFRNRAGINIPDELNSYPCSVLVYGWMKLKEEHIVDKRGLNTHITRGMSKIVIDSRNSSIELIDSSSIDPYTQSIIGEIFYDSITDNYYILIDNR